MNDRTPVAALLLQLCSSIFTGFSAAVCVTDSTANWGLAALLKVEKIWDILSINEPQAKRQFLSWRHPAATGLPGRLLAGFEKRAGFIRMERYRSFYFNIVVSGG